MRKNLSKSLALVVILLSFLVSTGGLHAQQAHILESNTFVKEFRVAGPFHEAFRELVMTEIWAEEFKPLLKKSAYSHLEIEVAPKQFNFAIGHAAKNKKELLN